MTARPAGPAQTPEGVGAAVGAAVGEGHTRRAVVRLLSESGPTSARQIGERLGLSAAGVRRHLDALLELGDVAAGGAMRTPRAGRGRPARTYRLTAAGRSRLGHRYDDLARAALHELRAVGGEQAVRGFARRRVDGILAGVAPAASDDDADVSAAADRVAHAFTDAGYATTSTRVGDGDTPLGVQICQHHCPVSGVAAEFPQLCEAESEALAAVLGTHVQRLATISNGDCACTTHVPLRAGRPAG